MSPPPCILAVLSCRCRFPLPLNQPLVGASGSRTKSTHFRSAKTPFFRCFGCFVSLFVCPRGLKISLGVVAGCTAAEGSRRERHEPPPWRLVFVSFGSAARAVAGAAGHGCGRCGARQRASPGTAAGVTEHGCGCCRALWRALRGSVVGAAVRRGGYFTHGVK